LGCFLSSQLHQLLGKLTPILGNSAPAKCPTAEPVTALPLFNGQKPSFASRDVGFDCPFLKSNLQEATKVIYHSFSLFFPFLSCRWYCHTVVKKNGTRS
jgi:hypothetical protein